MEFDDLFRNSSKAELMEELDKVLPAIDKAIVILITDRERGKYHSQVMLLGINNSYEAYGILRVAEQDLQKDEPVNP